MSTVAPWDQTPLFEQMLFFFTDVSSKFATKFLTTVLENHEKRNDEQFLWATAYSILPENHHSYLKSQIEIGFFNPRGEAYREMARSKGGSNYDDIIVIGKEVETQHKVHFLPSEKIEIQPFELQFGVPESIVYANLSSKSAAAFVLELIEGNKQFSLRPTTAGGQFGINLRGFGIEMRPFKYSMEYGVKDSIVLEAKNNTKDLHNDETVSRVSGIPESYYDISEIQDFDYRFASWVTEHRNESLTDLMRDFTNNYPLFMNEILDTNVTEEAGKYMRMLTRMRNNEQYVSSINGRHFPINNLDVFNLIDTINKERSMNEILVNKFHFNETQASDFIGTNLVDENVYILDTRSKYVHYLNDIENDEETKDWPNDYSIFFSPLMNFPKVRHPIVNYIMFVDPFSLRGLSMVYSSKMIIENEYPVNAGIVPKFNLGNKLARKVAFAFYHLALNVNDTVATRFLTNTFSIAGFDPFTRMPLKPTEATWMASYNLCLENANKTLLKWTELNQLYTGSKELDLIIETNNFMKEIGVEPDCAFMNGRYLNAQMIIQGIYQELQQSILTIAPLINKYRPNPEARFDPFKLLSHKFLMVPNVNSPVLVERKKSLDIYSLSVDRQNDFIDFIHNMKWDFQDNSTNISSYFLLFCNESTDLTVFKEFAQGRHSTPAAFAINPQVPESLQTIFPSNVEAPVLIANGRVFNNINISDAKTLALAEKWLRAFVYGAYAYIEPELTTPVLDASAYMSAIIMDWRSTFIERRLYSDEFWETNNTLIYNTKNSTADLTWDLCVDPTSRNYQRIADIVRWIEKNNIARIRLCVLPPSSLKDSMPTITTYYRNALDNDLAVFTMLNDTTTYSAMPDMPLSWVTESMRASTDLDNILLSQLTSHSQEGVYVLTNILLEGDCMTINEETAEGTELALTNVNGEKSWDTIAMQNGYFQLQANPGEWFVELGGAKSNSIFSLPKQQVVISSFASSRTVVAVTYRKGMEGMKVSNVSSTSDYAHTNRVDVFSVASGHLYERLMKIMMLSVRSRSTHDVKFWLIKNFLSPTFKATLPIMAEKYNFSYQLVTYKWPTWLRQQTEKQRIIWGNKILFLDTLFPLDLDRVIYVDADQIVRTDLNELMRMDYQGAPYAFTPMCSSREETEPFRFWHQGYWLQHLRGKPYHISALFAIDLRRLRQMNAGDYLRYHYQKLSADPFSLSNLDQDLPNDIQDIIPIFSLPQEWLWCETWCSDETMSTAKTIDLCNNPLTHAPKLEIAQKRIEEWPRFDELARNISAAPEDYQKQFFP
jgi:UDP-glucose:glycoprotein glucosyltransferase